jgi:FkbM family methyltransferase
MPSLGRLLVSALKFCCEIDRAVHRLLSAIGCRRNFYGSKGQDRWIVERVFASRRDGYFVEIGAADGRTHSNTYVLERDYNWNGVVIEANPDYIPELRRNRNCCCVHSCVDGQMREVDFFCYGFMGGIISEDTDNALSRRGSLINKHLRRVVTMRTTALPEILREAGAPPVIDYLSIDVEGAEYRILRDFPFDQFTFGAITVERPTLAIHTILTAAGYILDRVYRYDGFYVSQENASKLGIGNTPFHGIAPKWF